jgi:hypothetical protein
LLKYFFWKNIKIIFIFIFKKIFLTSAHQNNILTTKILIFKNTLIFFKKILFNLGHTSKLVQDSCIKKTFINAVFENVIVIVF